MATTSLTDERVRKLTKGAKLKYLWDTKLSGFGVRCTPAGTKSFVVGYRSGRRWRVTTIGRVSEMSIVDARDAAMETLVAVRKGADPVAERAARRGAASLGDLLDRWMVEHSERENRPSTITKNRALIRRNISGAISPIPAAEVTFTEIDGLKTRLRQKPVEFNRCLALLRAAFNWAIKQGIVDRNPTARVKPFAEQPRDRVLSADELQKVAKALVDMEHQGFNRHAIVAVRLLAMTGWRISEALGLRWDDMRPDRGEARLVDTKTGTRWATISTEAMALLDGLPRAAEFVFPGRSKAGNLGYNAVARALNQACNRAGVEGVSPHVFRASAATAMAESGAGVFALRDAFGWKGLAMPQRYVKRVQQSARDAVEQHGARTAAIMAGKPKADLGRIESAHKGKRNG